MSVRSLAVSIVLATVVAPALSQEIPKTNCDLQHDPYRHTVEVRQRAGRGPFRLVAMHCQYQLPNDVHSRFPVVVSPDVASIAVGSSRPYADIDEIAVARLSSPAAEATHRYDIRGLYAGALAFPDSSRAPIRWSADSETLWSARAGEENAIRAIRMEGGAASELPELRHAAGALNALLWTDDGRALALFGIDKQDPALAFVDAARGRVIESLPLREIGTVSKYRIRAAEVVALRDGRLRAFLRMKQTTSEDLRWVVWTQGAQPRFLPDPYSVLDPVTNFPLSDLHTAISADGGHVLIVRLGLHTDPCPPRRFVDVCGGPSFDGFAALHDLETGRRIWTITTRGALRVTPSPPELSDDGRYALIALPGPPPFDRYSIALISTRDGSVQQRFPIEEGGNPSFGFARGSRRMWIHISHLTTVYELR